MPTTERISVEKMDTKARARGSRGDRAVVDFPKANLTQQMVEMENRIVNRLTDYLAALPPSLPPERPPPSGQIQTMMEELRATLEQIRGESNRSAQGAVTASVMGAGLGVFQAIATILAVRVILLLTLCGGFFLAVSALQRNSPMSVAVLVAYAVLFIFPVAALEWRGKHKGD
jgi:hypothetical protein